MWREINVLIRKEWQVEMRQRFALGGLLLYVVSTVFVCYLSFKQIVDPATWNALFWIIILFASLNAVAKSFVQDSDARYLYYYTLASPRAIVLAKMLYNSLLIISLSIVGFFVFFLFMGSLVVDLPVFIMSLLLGSLSFSSVLTMVSAISARSGNNFALMAVLSFPLMLPMLLSVMKLSAISLGMQQAVNIMGISLVLILLSAISMVLAYILFPYLWRD